MADYKVVDAQQLDGDLTVLADAIRERAGSEGKMAFPHGMAQTVKSIPTGGVTLPALDHPAGKEDVLRGKEYINGSGQKKTGSFSLDDEMMEQDALILQISNALRNKAAANTPGTLPPLENPAASTDMATGKELYDQNGNVVTGSLYEVLEGKTIGATEFVRLLEDGNGDINTWATQNTGDAVVRNNAIFRTVAPASAFGDATPDQVVKGATFTSAAGLLVEGTHECEGGVKLPELTNPATATDLALDKQLIDENGNILTGTLPESGVDTNVMAADAAFWGNSLENTQFSLSGVYSKGHIGDADFRGFICRPGTNFVLRNIPTSLFGDAAADQVAKGATFTSAAGLLVEGTMEAESGGVQMYVDGETLVITGAVTVENETLIL